MYSFSLEQHECKALFQAAASKIIHSLAEKKRFALKAQRKLVKCLAITGIGKKSEKEQINETSWCYSRCRHTRRNTHVHICRQKIIFSHLHGL